MSSGNSVDTENKYDSDKSMPISKVLISGDNDEYVILDNKRYMKHDLMRAFGGTLNPERYAPYPEHKFGNAAVIGLAGFSLTAFVLGLYTTGAMGIKIPNMIVALVIFYGGVMMFIAGVWEMVIGNCFAATALGSYGPFWLGYGAIFIKSFGISAAYGDDATQLNNAIGFYLLGWTIFTFLIVLCTFKSTFMFLFLFFMVGLTLALLAAANMSGSANTQTAGGVAAIIAGVVGWYNTVAGIATIHNSYVTFTGIPLPIFGKQEAP